MNAILNFIINKPKTYIPLLVILITWGLGQIGFDITPELKESIYTICAAAAAWLIRRGMVKEKAVNASIDARVEERIDRLLDNMAAAKAEVAREEAEETQPKRTPGKAR